jgi:hypothetical protein
MSKTKKAALGLTVNEAAKYLKLKPNYLSQLRHYGKGPKFSKASGRISYHKDDLDTWLAARAAAKAAREAASKPKAAKAAKPAKAKTAKAPKGPAKSKAAKGSAKSKAPTPAMVAETVTPAAAEPVAPSFDFN